MKTSWRSASLVATAAAVLALTTACGSQDGTQSAGSQNVGATAVPGGIGSISTTPGNGYGADSTTAPSASASAGGQAPGQLAVVDNAKLGKIVTDGSGFTLHGFHDDRGNIVADFTSDT